MVTYDRTYEYRADYDGHEFAGHIVGTNMADALKQLEDRPSYGSSVDVRLLIEVKRTTCCQRGDWSGADHQPSNAFIYVPHFTKHVFRGETHTTILPETNPDAYLWQCEYCGRVGIAAELNGA